MSHIQFSFLGAPQRRNGEDLVLRKGDYADTQYLFADGSIVRSKLFAIALARHQKPDEIVLMGTPGSAWHQFLDWAEYPEHALDDASELQSRLTSRAALSQVNADDVAAIERLVLPIDGIPWRLRLISTCENQPQFEDLLALMAGKVNPGDRVSLDVTHGLRHLPMLSLLAALYLRKVKQVTVEDIAYGAFELRRPSSDGVSSPAPVLSLGGALDIADWLDAISRFEASGDYSQFATFLSALDGQRFRQASFYERSGQMSRMKPEIRWMRKTLGERSGSTFRLFEPTLRDHIDAGSQRQGYPFLRRMAHSYLKRRDYLRVTIFALEAFCTRLSPHTRSGSHYEIRKQALDDFIEERSAGSLGLSSDELATLRLYARQLRWLRNTFSHAGDPQERQTWGATGQNPLTSEKAMVAYLQQALKLLLPERG